MKRGEPYGSYVSDKSNKLISGKSKANPRQINDVLIGIQ